MVPICLVNNGFKFKNPIKRRKTTEKKNKVFLKKVLLPSIKNKRKWEISPV